LLLVGALTLTGCTSKDSGTPLGVGDKPSGDTGPAPKAKLVADPAVDAKDVPVLKPIRISVTEGQLTDVAVTGQDGKAVKGEVAADKLSWANTERLAYGKTYTYAAKAMGSDNKPVELKGTFATMNPQKVARATVNPTDKQTVGVGMPISVKFQDGFAPKDRAAVEKALKVETTPKVEGGWAWISASQVDWRPKEYWPANTKVEVAANLYGVDFGNGFGKADVTSKYSIGRNQVLMSTPRTTSCSCTATARSRRRTRPATARTPTPTATPPTAP